LHINHLDTRPKSHKSTWRPLDLKGEKSRHKARKKIQLEKHESRPKERGKRFDFNVFFFGGGPWTYVYTPIPYSSHSL